MSATLKTPVAPGSQHHRARDRGAGAKTPSWLPQATATSSLRRATGVQWHEAAAPDAPRAHGYVAHLGHLWRRQLRRELHGACKRREEPRSNGLSLRSHEPLRRWSQATQRHASAATECGCPPFSLSGVGFRCQVRGRNEFHGSGGLRCSIHSFAASSDACAVVSHLLGRAIPHTPGAGEPTNGILFERLMASRTFMTASSNLFGSFTWSFCLRCARRLHVRRVCPDPGPPNLEALSSGLSGIKAALSSDQAAHLGVRDPRLRLGLPGNCSRSSCLALRQIRNCSRPQPPLSSRVRLRSLEMRWQPLDLYN